MNTRSQKNRSYLWIGRAIDLDTQLQISHYRGLHIQPQKNISEICIFLGEFILIENEDTDQLSVARLLKLYENGDQEKHAVVQWFSRIGEIPLGQRMSLGREASQEIFLNDNTELDSDIIVTSIVNKVMVIPLSSGEALPAMSKDEQIFFVRESWNGKKFRSLSPTVLAELKGSVKMKSNVVNFATEYHSTPSSTICSLEVEMGRITRSTRKNKNAVDIESRHSTSKSSVSKERHSQRMANGIVTPGAKKKLQLNSPTKSSRTTMTAEDVIGLLDYDSDEPQDRSILKRKVTFTGNKSSPPKITCAADEEDLSLDIKPLGDERRNTSLLSSCKMNQSSSLKTRSSAVKESATDPVEQESEARIPALTPRSRRKCALVTAHRIAKQLSMLDSAREVDEDTNFLPLVESSDSSSSDEEDAKLLHTPKRHARATPKTSGKPPAHTPAKNPIKTPESRTPRTPHKATPRIRSRSQTAQKPTNVLEEARLRLHVSAVPESLPCREKEFQDIYNFIESKLIDGTGGCMYISGVPGTGKTATVHEAIRCLHQETENNELPSFQFIEINGMKLTDPHQAYVQILKLLTGQKATATHAAVLLEKMFGKPGSERKTVVLIVDELDLLWTRKQNVMYNLFDWPTQKHAKLIVLAIANTMDLPERIMMNRVASRLGLTRMSFQPYTYKQLQQIISSRMGKMKAFEEDAIQFIARKVAALSGDARRCLDICRRSTEICELSSSKSTSGLVSMAHVMEAMDEMFSSPYINTIRNSSLQEQIFLKATVAEFHRLGLEEATVQQIFHQHVALCRMEGLQTPTLSDIMAISSRLSACRLLLVESSNKYLHMRVRLNVSQDDVMYALKEE
ncbi:origin recognition complex subunit 1 [Tiliqua scincoides]|uniref:origin recognition complex subunit 1 n=1 Tax=Tiliqua scincoides TaxID=71010 RepID=UPI003461A7CC